MSVKLMHSAAALVSLLLVIAEPSCQPQPEPVEPPLPTVIPTADAEGYRTVSFFVETFENRQPTRRHIVYTITGFQEDGEPGDPVDPTTGVPIGNAAGAVTDDDYTTFRRDVTLSPGMRGTSITAVLFGRKGEVIRCRAVVDGETVYTDSKEIVVVGPGGRGATSASCVYLV